MVNSQPVVMLRAVIESMAMQWQGSALMSVAQDSTKDRVDTPSLASYLGPCKCPRAVQNWPQLSAAALRGAGPAHRLGSTVELAWWKEQG